MRVKDGEHGTDKQPVVLLFILISAFPHSQQEVRVRVAPGARVLIATKHRCNNIDTSHLRLFRVQLYSIHFLPVHMLSGVVIYLLTLASGPASKAPP